VLSLCFGKHYFDIHTIRYVELFINSNESNMVTGTPTVIECAEK
jgi:hypothetical protein